MSWLAIDGKTQAASKQAEFVFRASIVDVGMFGAPMSKRQHDRTDEVMRTAHKFGYAIDYNKKIAEQEQTIAFLTSPTTVALSADFTEEEYASNGKHSRLYDVLMTNPSRAVYRGSLVGLSENDVRALFAIDEGVNYERDVEPLLGPSSDEDIDNGYRLRSHPVLNDKNDIAWVYTEKERVACLKKAKSELARYKRNKAKFGNG